MNPTVVWTFRGERQLHFLLSRLNRLADRVGEQAWLTDHLRMVFPDAVAVIVLDLYLGFRDRPNEYTLLVDVRKPVEGAGGTVVVKLVHQTTDDRLRLECEAWAHTREAQFDGDAVLMRQWPVYHPQYRHRLLAVCYQDAKMVHIGLDRQVSLEEAFVGAVRFDTPSVASVGHVFDALFDSLGRELYAGASARDVLTSRLDLNPDNAVGGRRSLTEPVGGHPATLEEWDEPRRQAVVQAAEAAVGTGTSLPGGGFSYTSPVPYFRRLERRLNRSRTAGSTAPPAPPTHTRHAVRFSRGPAHGDLHGRNVLVGVRDDVAARPAVFDYEHMNRDNLVALDFAKLEKELKLRAYRYAFPFPGIGGDDAPPREYIQGVHDLEAQLCGPHPAGRPLEYTPPAGGPATPPQARLFELLCRLRRLAAECLRPINPMDWEREFFFALAAYSLYTVRFDQSPSLRAAAYVAAGVAAAAFDRL